MGYHQCLDRLTGHRLTIWMSYGLILLFPLLSIALPAPVRGGLSVAVPLYFEANQGQTDAQVKFLSRGPGYTAFLTPTEMVLRLPAMVSQGRSSRTVDSSGPSGILRMTWLGANPVPALSGVGQQASRSHYFIGGDPQQWRTRVAHYSKVRYADLYPDVDLVFYGDSHDLAYDFIVAPRADLTRITLGFQGAQTLEISPDGDLLIATAGRVLRMRKPFVYQDLNGTRQEVRSQYVRRGRYQVGFRVAAYDRTQPLVIDPVLSYSTFLGGSQQDLGFATAVDTSGHVYVTGRTTSADFPTTTGVVQDQFEEGINDAFVAKLTPDGSALVYATYLGGSRSESGQGIAASVEGHAYVVGDTGSEDFPVTSGALQAVAKGVDVFVAKLAPDGDALVYATRLGGTGSEDGADIAVDAVGHAYITGTTPSNDFPTSLDAVQPTNATGTASPDAFVAKLNPSGSALLYSTYLGGSGLDGGRGIAIDATGSAYIIGNTTSDDFPTVGPAQMLPGGDVDAFVAKVSANGSTLLYATYLGGTNEDTGADIALDATDHAYVVGATKSGDFPVTSGAFQTLLGGEDVRQGDAWIAKLMPDGRSLVYASYLGGRSREEAHGVAVDALGHAFVTGETSSLQDFPTVLANAIQTGFGGGTDAFLTQFSLDGSDVLLSTYLGGLGTDRGHDIALDVAGNVYLVGQASSDQNFPTAQPLQPTVTGSSDVFIMKIGDVDLPAVPICDLRMSQSRYQPGERVTVDIVRRVNPGSLPVALEIKMWLQAPDGMITSVENTGADGSVLLPAGSDVDTGPLELFEVGPETEPGRYEFSCRMLDPFTGKLIAEDRNPFDIP